MGCVSPAQPIGHGLRRQCEFGLEVLGDLPGAFAGQASVVAVDRLEFAATAADCPRGRFRCRRTLMRSCIRSRISASDSTVVGRDFGDTGFEVDRGHEVLTA